MNIVYIEIGELENNENYYIVRSTSKYIRMTFYMETRLGVHSVTESSPAYIILNSNFIFLVFEHGNMFEN